MFKQNLSVLNYGLLIQNHGSSYLSQSLCGHLMKWDTTHKNGRYCILAKFCILPFKLNCHCVRNQKRELLHKFSTVLSVTKSLNLRGSFLFGWAGRMEDWIQKLLVMLFFFSQFIVCWFRRIFIIDLQMYVFFLIDFNFLQFSTIISVFIFKCCIFRTP